MNTKRHGRLKYMLHGLAGTSFLLLLVSFVAPFLAACRPNPIAQTTPQFGPETPESHDLSDSGITATSTPPSFVCLDCGIDSALNHICPLANGSDEFREALLPYGEVRSRTIGDHTCLYAIAMDSPNWGYVYYVDEMTVTIRFVIINVYLLTPSPTVDPNSPTPGESWSDMTATPTPPFFGCVDCGTGSALESICPIAGGDNSLRAVLSPYGEVLGGSIDGHECLYVLKFDSPTWGYLYFVDNATESVKFAIINAYLLTPSPTMDFNTPPTETPTATPLWIGELGWGRVTGVVSDGITGRSIVGARVTCRHVSYNPASPALCNDITFTDGNGVFVFENVYFNFSDRITVHVEAPDLVPVTVQRDFFSQPEFYANVYMQPIGVTPMICCTPPLCKSGEVFSCPGECPCGCGTTCATITPGP